MKREGGQVLVIAILLLVVVSISIPALIKYMQSDSQWTLKEQRTTRAFQLAEGAVEQGYQQIVMSTAAWTALQGGTPLPNFNFDKVYNDGQGGTYAIKMTGNAANQTATVIGVGKDTSGNEMRAISATYVVPGAYPASIYALQSATVQGNPTIEWGPMVSPGAITTDSSHLHPRYYSSSKVDPFDISPAPPNTDNKQWWSYYTLGAAPQIDLASYKSSAGPGCTDQPSCLSSACSICYYTSANYPTFDPGTNNFYTGSLIVEGNLDLHGHYGTGTVNNQPIPSTAWKEYANDWAFYVTNYDPTCPYANYAAASAAGYSPTTLTKATISNLFVHGFIYIGGTISIAGGGNGDILGSMYCATVANLGSSHVTFWYDNAVISTIRVKNSQLIRQSWQDLRTCSWDGTYPVCS